MSYNVTSWKTKKLDSLQIPLDSLYKSSRKSWHPERVNHDDGSVSFEFMSGTIKGSLKENIVFVSSIEFRGEGSGTDLHEIVEPALEDSKGRLVASRVWESGDEIDRLIVKDGIIKVENVEL